MNFTETFPLRFCLNLAHRQDRRARCEEEFARHALPVRRFPAVNAKWVRKMRGFESAGRYAHALGTRMMLRRAWLAKVQAVFIFEDDVTLAPDLHERLAEISLPDDWGILYLGGMHLERPEPMSRGLVRMKGALSTHAFGVRAPHYRRVMQALRGRERAADRLCPPADAIMARLCEEIPTYAVYPALAGQAENHSDLQEGVYKPYTEDGQQVEFTEALWGLMAESLGGKAYAPAKAAAEARRGWFRTGPLPTNTWRETWDTTKTTWPRPAPFGPDQKVAFLFVTRGGHHQPEVWTEYWREHGERVSVHGHAKERAALPDGWLKQAQIREHIPTNWGDINVVRAEIALLRSALANPANSFFVFASESCLPIRPLGDLLRLLELDPRSRFAWESVGELQAKKYHGKVERILAARRIPAEFWAFHSQWILLNREAATLAAEDDFTGLLTIVPIPDECYFGTVLRMKGYPLADLVAPHTLTWAGFQNGSAHPETYAQVTSSQAAEFLASGCYFARKFPPDSNIKEWRLHEPAPYAPMVAATVSDQGPGLLRVLTQRAM